MAKTHLVFTDKRDGLRIARPKGRVMLAEMSDGTASVSGLTEETSVLVSQETFDELLKQLEETNGV